ncbi:helix-turn-helix domain-containing protein [Roseococcus sp. DSY-14]|uniref:helix-turn-helix domain-containing protein n=1 Tax=Roseococcus sp. DSY-14 TaxID=3369650 RepID=UPI00387AF58E
MNLEKMTGIELKTVLLDMQMTQAEFCRLIGCQPPTMSRYVRGGLPVPAPLAALADVLRSVQDRGHDAARLLREARHPRPEQRAA